MDSIKIVDIQFLTAARTSGQIAFLAVSHRFEKNLAVEIWEKVLNPYGTAACTKSFLHFTPSLLINIYHC